MAKKQLTAGDIINRVQRLKDNKGMSDLRADIEVRRRSHGMTNDPILPEHYASAGNTAILNSARISEHWKIRNALLSGLATQLQVIPGGKDAEYKADKAERSLAVQRADLFTYEVRTKCGWNQGICAFGVYKLCCLGPESKRPWRVDSLSPTAVYFPKGPLHPKVVGYEYTMLAHEVTSTYGKDRNKQEYMPDSMPVVKAGKVKWVALSDAAPVDEGWEPDAEDKDAFEPVAVVEYDDGSDTWVVVKNKDAKTGEIVHHYKNPHSGTAYWIVPGHLTGADEPREWLLPDLWALMNVVDQITFVRCIWATRATENPVQLAIQKDPQLINAAQATQMAVETTQAQAQLSGLPWMEFNGRVFQINRPKDEDLQALMADLTAEYQEMASSELSVTTADVVTQGTMGAQQLAVGVREKLKGPFLTYRDDAEAGIMMQVVETITGESGYVPNEGDGWTYFARGGEQFSKGESKVGERYEITAKMFDFDRPDQWIKVSTSSKTDEAKQVAFQYMVQAYQLNFATTDQVLEAMGVQDIAGWHEAHAEDEAIKGAAKLINENFYMQLLKDMLLTDGGVNIQTPMVQPQVTTTDVSGGRQPTPPPATAGVNTEAAAGYAA